MSPLSPEQSNTPEHGEHSPRDVARKITGVVLEELKKLKREQSSDSDEVARVVSELAQTDFAKVAEAVMAQVETPAETLQAPDASSALASVDQAFADFDRDVRRRHEDDRGEHLKRVITKRQELQTWVQQQVEALQSGERSVWQELQQKVAALQQQIDNEASTAQSAMWKKKDVMKQLEQQHAGVPSIKDEASARVRREISSETTWVVEALFTQTDIPSNLSYAFSNLRAGGSATDSELQDHQRSEVESSSILVQRVEQDLNGLDRWNQEAGNIDTARTMQDIQDAVNALQSFFESNRLIAAAVKAASSPEYVDFTSFLDRIRTAPTVYQAREIFSQVDELVRRVILNQQAFLNIFQSFSAESDEMSTRKQRQLAALQGVTTEDQQQYAQLSREVQSLSGDKHVLEGLEFPAMRMKRAVDTFLQSQSAATEAQTTYDQSLGQALGSGSESFSEGLSPEAKRILDAMFASLKDELAGMSPEQVQQVQTAVLQRVESLQRVQTRSSERQEQAQRQAAIEDKRQQLLEKHPRIDIQGYRKKLVDLRSEMNSSTTTEGLNSSLSQLSELSEAVSTEKSKAEVALLDYPYGQEEFQNERMIWTNLLADLLELQRDIIDTRSEISQKQSDIIWNEQRQKDAIEYTKRRQQEQYQLQSQLQNASQVSDILTILHKLSELHTMWKVKKEGSRGQTDEARDPRLIAESIRRSLAHLQRKDFQAMEQSITNISSVFGIQSKVAGELRTQARAIQEKDARYRSALKTVRSLDTSLKETREALQILADLGLPMTGDAAYGSEKRYDAKTMLANVDRVVNAASYDEAEAAVKDVTSIGNLDVKAYKAFVKANGGWGIGRLFRGVPQKLQGRL